MILRPSARVLLLDPSDRLLLVLVDRPYGLDCAVWLTPGGGVDPGESFEQAALRELVEETGIRDVELSPCVWLREYRFVYKDEPYLQQERYYLVRVPDQAESYDLTRATDTTQLLDWRWWALEELPGCTEPMLPPDLGTLVPHLLREGCPVEPVDITLAPG